MQSDDLRNLFDRAKKRLTDFAKRQLWKIYFRVRWSYAGRIGYTMFMKQKAIPEEKIHEIYLMATRSLLEAFREPWPELFHTVEERVEKSRNDFALYRVSEIGRYISETFVQMIAKLESKHRDALFSSSDELRVLKLKTSDELKQLRKEKAELEVNLKEKEVEINQSNKIITDQKRIIADQYAQIQILTNDHK